jgi:hypothetical protein
VSLLAWDGEPMAIIAKNAGHSIATAERHYLKTSTRRGRPRRRRSARPASPASAVSKRSSRRADHDRWLLLVFVPRSEARGLLRR